jgi:hypothetical protein
MKPEVKAKVLPALRSGEYKQTRGRLHLLDHNGGHSFCCLGVIATAMGKEWCETLNHSDEGVSMKIVGTNCATGQLPDDLLVQYGMSPHDQFLLTDMNDCQHMSFEEIANVIEEGM